MKSVSEYDRKIWLSDYSQKDFDVSIGGEWIPTAKFNAESLKITQILDDSSQLEFIGCKAAKLELTIIDTDEEYEGKEIRVYAAAYIEGMQGTQKIRLFNGTIAEVKQKSHDDIMVTLVAYDNLADILQMDLAEWYKGLTFPMTLGAFVRALPFRYFPWGDLPFENLMIEKTIEPDVLPAKDVLAAITTLNGRYCVWDDSAFKLIALKRYEHDGLFPANDLYPADDLFPMDPTTNAEHIPDEEYFKAEYQDYDVQGIDKVQIRSEENDIGAIYGTGSNAYIIQGNFLLFGKSAADLASIAQRVYEEVQGFVFVPAKIECKSRPWVECGDLVRVYTEKKVVYTYVMQRTLSGMSFMYDSYSAKQGNVRNEQVNSLNTQIIQLKGKANKLVRDVEHLSSEIYNEDGSSKIEQNAQEIKTKVSDQRLNEMGLSGANYIKDSSTMNVFGVDGSGNPTHGTVTYNADGSASVVNVNQNTRFIGSPISVDAGTYTISCYLKNISGDDLTNIFMITAHYADGHDEYLNSADHDGWIVREDGWIQKYFVFEVRDGIQTIQPWFHTKRDFETANNSYTIKWTKVEKGSTPTAWIVNTSEFSQTATQISAKVEKVGGNQSFSWELLADGFVLKANGQEVFRCDAGGITVSGYATATKMSAAEGRIGTLETVALTADNINSKTFTLGSGHIGDLDASKITSGRISTDHLSTSVITTGNLSAQSISAGQISGGTMSGNLISGGGATLASLNCSEYLANYGNVTYKLTPHRFTVGGAARTIFASAN